MERTVDATFDRLAAGALTRPAAQPEDGWTMQLPSGTEVTRSQLQAQAVPLVRLGAGAVPALLRWVMNDQLALRYVAAHALEQITGVRGGLSHFDPDTAGTERARAAAAWQAWYDAHGTTGGR